MADRGKMSSVPEIECPVCTDQYKDPRLLSCGHHFCLVCLQKIAEDSDVIICPTCRYQTEKPVDALKEYKFSDFEINANIFTSKDEFTKKLCSSCHESMGSKSCMDCKMIFCDICREKHRLLEVNRGHRLHPLSEYQFCKIHPDVFIVFVCADCNIGCCFTCTNEHEEHSLSDLRTLAEKTRSELLSKARSLQPLEKDQRYLEDVTKKRESLETMQLTFKGSASKIHGCLTQLIEKLELVRENTNEKFKAELKRLGMLEWDLKKFIYSKKKLDETLGNLQENLSDADVVFRSHDYPKYTSSSCFSLLETGVVQVANLRKITKAATLIEELTTYIEVDFSKISLNGIPIRNLKLDCGAVFSTINQTQILGLMCHPVTNELVVRTNFQSAPLQIFNPDGELIKTLGKRLSHVTSDTMKAVGYDVKKEAYLLPLSNGKIVALTENDNILAAIDIPQSKYLGGIFVDLNLGHCYVADCLDDKIYRVNPKKRSVDKTIVMQGSLQKPYFIVVTYDKTLGQKVLVVGYLEQNSIHVSDMSGKVLQTYDLCLGGSGPARARGICIDPDGRILVCDKDNNRIVAFWTEDGKPCSEILIDKEQLIKEGPRHISLDVKNRVLYVGYDDGIVNKFKEQF